MKRKLVNGVYPVHKRSRASDLCEEVFSLSIETCSGRNAASFAGNDEKFGRNTASFAGNEENVVELITKSLSQLSICLGYMCDNACCEDSVMIRIDPDMFIDASQYEFSELSGCRDLVLCERYICTQRSSRIIGRFTVIDWYSQDDPCSQPLKPKQPDLHTATPDQITPPAHTVSNSLTLPGAGF